MSNLNQTQLLRESLRTLVRKLGVLDRGEALCCGITLSQSYSIVEIGRAGIISVNRRRFSGLTKALSVDRSISS
ncbi:hypothetical protein SPSIL_046950 [Sporomusa silvacetica DSM 10669]|uniref:Uncharacterized protein n=1 Tax=Sporomusa silvacetica DSM 10669 TaxID=1123289 RepID=A0ABZ3ISS1_9FIRM|nr:hypothetical protein SPSIL_00500 [Sporomusa silvacetica DSM 10669]